MKKWIVIVLLLASTLMFVACSDDEIPTESTITSKEVVDGGFYFHVTYDLEGYYDSLTATIKVTERIYNQYEIGDTYVFNRPDPSKNYRTS